jgi:branched-chain amino acid aminotransferase
MNGLFETIKVYKGRVLLLRYHFERMMKGFNALNFEVPEGFTAAKLEKDIITECRKANWESLARIRYTVIEGMPHKIESWPLDEEFNKLNEQGWMLDIYPAGRKKVDNLIGLKLTRREVFEEAAAYAKENQLDDAIVLNEDGFVCDSSIANVFLVKDGKILTPSLDQGCVAGVMRRLLIENLVVSGYSVEEKRVTIDELLNANEVFLTNAIRGVRWVAQLGEKNYANNFSSSLVTWFSSLKTL